MYGRDALIEVTFHQQDSWDADTKACLERAIDATDIVWHEPEGNTGARVQMVTPSPGSLFDWLMDEGFEGWSIRPL